MVIKEGSVSVSIYSTVNSIADCQGTKCVKKKCTDLTKAMLGAEAVVLKLTNRETEALKLSPLRPAASSPRTSTSQTIPSTPLSLRPHLTRPRLPACNTLRLNPRPF